MYVATASPRPKRTAFDGSRGGGGGECALCSPPPPPLGSATDTVSLLNEIYLTLNVEAFNVT